MAHINPFTDAEKAYESVLPSKGYAVIRVDGNNFGSFTKQFERPYSKVFAGAMNKSAKHLATIFTGTLFVYVQSDEISVVMTDQQSENAEYSFGGRIQKLSSIAASNAGLAFAKTLPEAKGMPAFDGRTFALDALSEVRNYLEYRRSDARRNAIAMVAQSRFSHKELQGKSVHDQQEMLASLGIDRIPNRFFHGRLITKHTSQQFISYTDKRSGQVEHAEALRSYWKTNKADLPAVDSLFDALSKTYN